MRLQRSPSETTSAFPPLPANPNGARSAVMPGSQFATGRDVEKSMSEQVISVIFRQAADRSGRRFEAE